MNANFNENRDGKNGAPEVANSNDVEATETPVAETPVAEPTIAGAPSIIATAKTPVNRDDDVVDNDVIDNDVNVERAMRQMSRRSFLWGALAAGATYGTYRWIGTRRAVDGIPWPLRQTHEFNTQLSQELFSSTRLAPTFDKSQISAPRVNGDIGLTDLLFDVEKWKLKVRGLSSGEELKLSLSDIRKLPRVEMTTEMKCIEGWSVIVTWAGARFSDFAQKYPPATQSGAAPNFQKIEDILPYVGLSTPDGAYYVGMDLPGALHPQTLLCYEMNGKPLTDEHGAPLRLVTPVKYGIKHIKRIGTIEYSNRRPDDYWAERGYDWGSGH